MAQIARVGDSVSCFCAGHGSGSTTFTGTIQTGSSTFKVNGTAVARLNDTGLLTCGHTFTIITASSIGGNSGIGIARVGDTVQSAAGGTGTITSGSSVASVA